MLLTGCHLVGDEGADDENAVLHIAKYHTVVQCCKQMVAAIVAHAAPCQSLIVEEGAVRLIFGKVTNQVQSRLLHVTALGVGIAVEDMLKEYHLPEQMPTTKIIEIHGVSSFLAPECQDSQPVESVIVPAGASDA